MKRSTHISTLTSHVSVICSLRRSQAKKKKRLPIWCPLRHHRERSRKFHIIANNSTNSNRKQLSYQLKPWIFFINLNSFGYLSIFTATESYATNPLRTIWSFSRKLWNEIRVRKFSFSGYKVGCKDAEICCILHLQRKFTAKCIRIYIK